MIQQIGYLHMIEMEKFKENIFVLEFNSLLIWDILKIIFLIKVFMMIRLEQILLLKLVKV